MSGWVDLSASTYLDDDHRQGVHVGFVRRFFFLLGPHDPIGIEKLGGAVTDRATVVGGRCIDRVDISRDRTKAKISEARGALCINENVRLGGASVEENCSAVSTHSLHISVDYLVFVEIAKTARDTNQLYFS